MEMIEIYHGHISFQEAELRLRPHPAGTFLLRSSRSEEGWIVIAFKLSQEDAIEQCLIKPCAEGRGYFLGTIFFTSIAEIIFLNSTVLRFPLSASEFVPTAVPFFATADEIVSVYDTIPTLDNPSQLHAAGGSSVSVPVKECSFAEAGRRTCPVCFDDGVARTVLVPCGHLLCKICAEKVSCCPICRATKHGTVVAWL